MKTKSVAVVVSVALWAGGLCSNSSADQVVSTQPAQNKAEMWSGRDTPSAAAKSDRQFFELIRLDGSTKRPELTEVEQLIHEDKPVEAMDRFARYFMTKLRYPERYGIAALDINVAAQQWPRGGTGAFDSSVLTAGADKLLNNVVVLNGKEVDIGEPGAVNWSAGDSPDVRARDLSLHTGGAFTPLARAYLVTLDRKYLDKWVAVMDDWCLNDHYLDTVHPCDVPDRICTDLGHLTVDVIRLLSGIAQTAPTGQSLVPPRVLGEVLRRLYAEGLPYRVSYIRSNTHNWTPWVELLLVSQFYDEFKPSWLYLREARRRNLEDNAATQNLRDGTENQQCPWYNAVYLQVADALRIVEGQAVTPGWLDLQNDTRWKNEINEHLKERITYQIHLRTPQGEWPIPLRGADKRIGFVGWFNQTLGEAYLDCPAAFQDPVNLQILTALTDPSSGVRPGYTSEWFPYGGYNIVRDGWEKDSGSGFLFCSPQPGAYGGYRSRSNNNTLGINGYGQDLLIEDTDGHYMYPSSPITVDGKNQFFHAGLYKVSGNSGHKAYQVGAWTEPANWRWHASESLNLMEGVYAGPWANPGDAPVVVGPYGKEEGNQPTMPLDQTLRGVTHQRLATYVRAAKLWIVTDRLSSDKPHTYEQVWWLPLAKTDGNYPHPSFLAEQVHIDSVRKCITTDAHQVVVNKKSVPKVNLSLYQFTTTQPTFSSHASYPKPIADGRTLSWGHLRIGESWKAEGDQQLVTAIFPRAAGTGSEGDLRNVHEIQSGRQGIGFEATTPDGSIVRYLASPLEDDDLNIGNVSIKGRSLLISAETAMALDCSEMTVDGRAVPNLPSDFEFHMSGDAISKVQAIDRPIDPVVIGPDRNVFTDSVAVTCASQTPGVEIRYTTDGSEPTPRSILYTGPWRLGHSAIVKARAYRPGVSENPPGLSGTQATVASTAVFDKAPSLVEPVKPARTNPGLVFQYWQDDWRKLFLQIDALKPAVTGTVPSLWDFSLLPRSNPPVGTQPTPRANYYAVAYSGYLNIPVDGVYTIRSPREFVYPDTEAGGDLRVYLGKNDDARPADPDQPLHEWYPSTRLHAFGTWSIALAKGLQPFKVVWIDYRTDAAGRLNQPKIKDYIWTGSAPILRMSGPGLDEQPIPTAWLYN